MYLEDVGTNQRVFPQEFYSHMFFFFPVGAEMPRPFPEEDFRVIFKEVMDLSIINEVKDTREEEMANLTKKALVKSLKKCLETKPIDRVTINDIVDDCGLNRMTFYYHFSSIYDCFIWGATEEVKEALEQCRSHSNWSEGVLELFRKAEENKTYVINIYRSINREDLERHLYSLVSDLLLPFIREESKTHPVAEKDLEFILDFYKFSIVGTILKWISSNMEERPEDIVEQFKIMLQDTVGKILQRFSEERPVDVNLR